MTRPIASLLIMATALSVAGCASLSLPFVSKDKSEVVRATQTNPVNEIVSLWEAAEGRGVDNLPTRGFAGQLLFFTFKHPTPAWVDGSVTVFVFDDFGSETDQSRPLWQHTFSSQEWNALARQTTLGTAYQVFIPYTRKGLHDAHCSLRIKFEPTDGGTPIYSNMANVTLSSGKNKPPESTLSHRRIEPEKFPIAAGDEPLPQPLKSSSIALPNRRRGNPQSASRLQQVAQEMLQEQQQSKRVEQAVYTESADDDAADEPDTAPESRYRLYR